MSQQSRAYSVALELAKQIHGFVVQPLHPDERPEYATQITLRHMNGAVISVTHHPPFKPNDKSDIHISVRKIDEAPYGLTPPSGKWGTKSKLTDADIAIEFMVQYGDQMESYVTQSLAARREAIAFYKSREALAQQLATVGNGVFRPDRQSDPSQIQHVEHIHCSGIESHWRVEHFNHSNTELHVRVTDEQALAIVAILANQP